MMWLIAYVIASTPVPTGTLVWATGGAFTAVWLAALLLVSGLALASQRDRPRTVARVPVEEDCRLPSAA